MRPTPCTGYETLFSRDTRHKNTGYGAHITGYEALISRDTGHAIHGIRDTALTGYGAQEKLLKWPGALIQHGFQDSEKIS